ncbi:MAG TPA: acylphosphatase [Gammaproteobacteria bacterium]
MIAKRCFVSGKVQGVFYRASTAERAKALDLTGYAKNLPDGRVEVLACGEEGAVQQLIAWLYQGPPRAEVDSVEIEEVKPGPVPADFGTR